MSERGWLSGTCDVTSKPSTAKRIATVTSGTVLTLGNLATAYLVWLALATPQPSGPGDHDEIDTVSIGAGIGMLGAMVCMIVTVVAIGADWLPRWWLLIPAALFVLALLRLHAMPSYR